jgi:hypothetical protein
MADYRKKMIDEAIKNYPINPIDLRSLKKDLFLHLIGLQPFDEFSDNLIKKYKLSADDADDLIIDLDEVVLADARDILDNIDETIEDEPEDGEDSDVSLPEIGKPSPTFISKTSSNSFTSVPRYTAPASVPPPQHPHPEPDHNDPLPMIYVPQTEQKPLINTQANTPAPTPSAPKPIQSTQTAPAAPTTSQGEPPRNPGHMPPIAFPRKYKDGLDPYRESPEQ